MWKFKFYLLIKRIAGIKESEENPKWLQMIGRILIWHDRPWRDVTVEHTTDSIKIFGFRFTFEFFRNLDKIKLLHPFVIVYRDRGEGYFTVVDLEEESYSNYMTPRAVDKLGDLVLKYRPSDDDTRLEPR